MSNLLLHSWTKDQSDKNKPTPEQLGAETVAWLWLLSLLVAFTSGLLIGLGAGR